jgi:hypothetical protein
MAIKDGQKLLSELVSRALNEPAQIDAKFPWFINQDQKEHFKDAYPIMETIFASLNGLDQQKGKRFLQCDAYFGGKQNFMFEFDELQHFSTARFNTFKYYPGNLKSNFSITQWKEYCLKYLSKADNYRFNKETTDFKFKGGRTCQRAYLDVFRDLLPQYNKLNQTLRVADFEVSHIVDITPL